MTAGDLPEPAQSLGDPAELLAAYLDYYRSVVLRKLDGLSDAQQRTREYARHAGQLDVARELADGSTGE